MSFAFRSLVTSEPRWSIRISTSPFVITVTWIVLHDVKRRNAARVKSFIGVYLAYLLALMIFV
jgi:hypothetical protein